MEDADSLTSQNYQIAMQLYRIGNFTGSEDDELVVAENARWRDNAYHQPLPENIADRFPRVFTVTPQSL